MAADIDVVLKYGLQQHAWGSLNRVVQFNGLLGSKSGHAQERPGKTELIADLAVHNAKGKAVMVSVRNQSVVAKSRRQLRILAVHIARAPVKTEIQIEAAVRTWCGPIDGLIRHDVN